MAAGVSFGGRFRLRRTSIRGLMGLTALVAFSVWLPLEGWPSLRRCLRYREMAAAWERESAATRVIAEAVDRRRVEPPQGGRRPDTPWFYPGLRELDWTEAQYIEHEQSLSTMYWLKSQVSSIQADRCRAASRWPWRDDPDLIESPRDYGGYGH